MSGYRCILTISDLHFPYQHKDAFPFLRAVKKKYQPDHIVNMGDEADKHAMSFHPSDSDLYSAGHELDQTIGYMQTLAEIFPQMDILESNHGSMLVRKAKVNGIPLKYLKTHQEVYETPDKWVWHEDLTLTMSNGRQVYFCHGKLQSSLKLSQKMGMSVAQGHYHEEFAIHYWGNPNALYWGMNTGCLIDSKSMAFAYNKVFPKRPVIGTGIIIDGLPKLLPMILNREGRWTKFVP